MAYSQTYNFAQNAQIDLYITKAFERCGIMGQALTGLQVQSAITDLNLMFSEWANKGINLFTVEKTMFQLNVGQPSYLLRSYTVDLAGVTASNNTRLLGGIPFSSAGGIAANAFNGNPNSAGCIQNAPNGNISYQYPINYLPSVYYVGIQSATNTEYSITVEYTLDNVLWNTSMVIPKQMYLAKSIQWFVIPSPINAQSIRIRETGGATLAITQLYFSMPSNSRILTPISREEWTSYPNKQIQATPSSFYIDRQDDPILTLWPTPDNSYQTLVFNSIFQIMDVTQMRENANIPQRFMEAAISGLAARMSLIWAPDKFPILDGLAERAFALAAREDVENVPMRIQPNIYKYV